MQLKKRLTENIPSQINVTHGYQHGWLTIEMLDRHTSIFMSIDAVDGVRLVRKLMAKIEEIVPGTYEQLPDDESPIDGIRLQAAADDREKGIW